MAPSEPTPSRVLVTLIDGDCALCSRYARLVSWLDIKGVVYFETQQSAVGKKVLRNAKQPVDLSTIVVVEVANGTAVGYTKSTAVLRTFAALGVPWSVAGVLLFVPTVVRDGVYTFVAKHRLKVFGANGGSCVLPDAVARRRVGRGLPKQLLLSGGD